MYVQEDRVLITMSSFSFNFLDNSTTAAEGDVTSSSPSLPLASHHAKPITKPHVWVQNLRERIESLQTKNYEFDSIVLGPSTSLWHVRENNEGAQRQFRNSDLVSGVYEGGLKVWECSLDLCRYLLQHNIQPRGMILELGCGHGLPGILCLQQAWQRGDATTNVYLTDFNEFVIDDVTIPNIVINLGNKNNIPHGEDPMDTGEGKEPDSKRSEEEDTRLRQWLSRHVALGSGDWNDLSRQLKESTDEARPPLSIIDSNSQSDLFDVILAAETTYSLEAATDTARFLANHLNVGGVAYIATKRYYFGVGGGSDSFQAAISSFSSIATLTIENIAVFDNGRENIRDLFRVQCMSRASTGSTNN